MFNIKKCFIVLFCFLVGEVSSFQNNCYAYNLSLYFGNKGYKISIDEKLYINDDYSLMSYNTLKEIKPFTNAVNTTIQVSFHNFVEIKNLLSLLTLQLKGISTHNDFNPLYYFSFTPEITESLNEKYINLFKFIKHLIM